MLSNNNDTCSINKSIFSKGQQFDSAIVISGGQRVLFLIIDQLKNCFTVSKLLSVLIRA